MGGNLRDKLNKQGSRTESLGNLPLLRKNIEDISLNARDISPDQKHSLAINVYSFGRIFLLVSVKASCYGGSSLKVIEKGNIGFDFVGSARDAPTIFQEKEI